MNWEAIGAIGEILGALAVLISLIYLAVQIRHNSSSVKSAAVQSVLESLNQGYHVGASSPQTAKIIIEGQTDFDSLDKDEKYQFILWMLSFFRSLELAHQHFITGSLSPSIWNGLDKQLGSLLQAESVRRIWLTRAEVFSDDFRNHVEKSLAETKGLGAAKARAIAFGDEAYDA